MSIPFRFNILDDSIEFDLFDFVGREGLSQLFCFDVGVSTTEPVDLDNIVGEMAGLNVRQQRKREENGSTTSEVLERTYYGIISEAQVGGRYRMAEGDLLEFYRFRLVPRFWQLTLGQRSRVFRQKTVGEIIGQVLEDNDLFSGDFEIDLEGFYEKRQYCVQYQESDFAFISRLMEYEGIYYYFLMDEGDQRDVLVITDVNPGEQALSPSAIVSELLGIGRAGEDTEIEEVEYNTGAGLGENPAISRITAKRTLVPAQVTMWDDDIEDFVTPDSEAAGVDVSGNTVNGAYEEYGDLLQEERQANKSKLDGDASDKSDREDRLKQLARRRSEEIVANQAKVFRGRSTDPRFFAAGVVEPFLWDQGGPIGPPELPGGEDRFLLTTLVHAGAQRARHVADLDTQETLLDPYPEDTEALHRYVVGLEEPAYVNEFACIPERIAYRPPRQTPVPRIPGVLTAQIEKQGGGDRVVDDEGRYKVKMHFDQEDHEDGSSRPIRMAQPYSGAEYGMHFPNKNDSEAVVSFIDGDVNRPVMLSTVPNPKTHAPAPLEINNFVTTEQTNLIRTVQNNQFILEDHESKLGVRIYTPQYESIIQLGSPELQVEPYALIGGVSIGTNNTVELFGKKGVVINAGEEFVPDLDAFQAAVEAVEEMIEEVVEKATEGEKSALDQIKAKLGELKEAAIDAVAGKLAGELGDWEEGIEDPQVVIEGESGIVFHSEEAGITSHTKAGYTFYTQEGGVDFGAKSGIKFATDEGGVSMYVKEGGISGSAFKGDISLTAQENNINLKARKKNISLDAEKEDVTVEAKKNVKLTGKNENVSLTAKTKDVKLSAEKKDIEGVAKKNVSFKAEDENISLEAAEKIVLTCGQSKIELRKNGTIQIHGKNIDIKGNQKVDVDGKQHVSLKSAKDIKIEAKVGVKIDGTKVNSKAKVMNKTEGNLVNSDASAASILKGGIVKIN